MRSIEESIVAVFGSIVMGTIYRGYVFPFCRKMIRKAWEWFKGLFLRRSRNNPANSSSLATEDLDCIEVSSGQRLRRLPDEISERH